jgi:hypothetical protein
METPALDAPERVLLLQHVVTDDNLMDNVSELLRSTLLEHVLLLQHAAMDDHLVDEIGRAHV